MCCICQKMTWLIYSNVWLISQSHHAKINRKASGTISKVMIKYTLKVNVSKMSGLQVRAHRSKVLVSLPKGSSGPPFVYSVVFRHVLAWHGSNDILTEQRYSSAWSKWCRKQEQRVLDERSGRKMSLLYCSSMCKQCMICVCYINHKRNSTFYMRVHILYLLLGGRVLRDPSAIPILLLNFVFVSLCR